VKQSDLDILLREGGGTMLEFKENLSASFARELVAMANTIGGKILIGVRDDGMAVGRTDSNNPPARIQDVARNCDLPVRVLVEPVANTLVVHVRAQGCPDPEFENNGLFTAAFRPNPGVRAQAETRTGAQSRAQSIQALRTLSKGDKSAREVAEALSLRSKTGALKRTLNELFTGGLIGYALPEKPSSRLQRYRLIRAGLEYLKKIEETM
jgi:predicted HTH transcriptional regulator